jgi:ribosomal protein L4
MAEETVTLPVMSERRQKVGEVQVPAPLVSGPVREALLHQMVVRQQASRRAGTAAT